MLRYLLPDGSCSKSLWIGCERSLPMLSALVLHRLWVPGLRVKRLRSPFLPLSPPSAGLFCPLHCSWRTMWRWSRWEYYPSMESSEDTGGSAACFTFLRKYSLCWACFTIPVRSSGICTPRNLMVSTLSPLELLMLRVGCSGRVFHLVHIMHQIVVSTPSHEMLHLLSVHCFQLSQMRRTTVVLSLNWMIRVPSWLEAQSCVRSVNSRGLSTQPQCDPVLIVIVLEVLFPTRTDYGLSVRKTRTQKHVVVSSPRKVSFSFSLCGKTILKAELKSMYSILA